MTTSIPIGPLLSTCVDACRRGCHEIRKVQAARESNGNKLVLQVQFKDALDDRSALTEADGNAQRAIVSSLRKEWGDRGLRIVGEEDDDQEDNHSAAGEDAEAEASKCEPLSRNLLAKEFGEIRQCTWIQIH